MRKNITGWKKSIYPPWLSLLLTGGAIFGVVDHLWKGELFLIREEPLLDIMLGVMISIAIFVVWVVIIIIDKTAVHKQSKQIN